MTDASAARPDAASTITPRVDRRSRRRSPRRRELGPEAVVRRIRRAILDEARLAAAEGVASEDDIDLALRLGASHPQGPFAWAASGEP